MTTAFAHHWQLALVATAVGLALGATFVAASCLAAPIRLHLAADPEKRARVLTRELGRVRRLGDAAAVSEEHGLAGAKELREEAGLRELLLRRAYAWRRYRGGAEPRLRLR